MNVTQEVIVDLLPVYLSGEASPATRTLVEEFLKQDAEFAQRVRLQWAESFAKLAPSAPPPDLELRSLRRTHHLLALQKWLFAIGIGLFATSFSFRFSSVGGRIQGPHFLLLDDPLAFASCVAPGLVCFIAYFILRRRLRATAP
jgi:predicted anti-sigma-YlaC factor YlaD